MQSRTRTVYSLISPRLVPVAILTMNLSFIQLLFVLGILNTEAVSEGTYRAAVFDKAPISTYNSPVVPTREEALQMVQPNLELYEEQAAQAHSEGSQIIVFAEYGLYPRGLGRDTIHPFLEEIPSPSDGWVPGSNISNHSGHEIIYSLSHMARSNGLYVVANMGDVVPCDRTTDPHCPEDNKYQYNTNVVFDPTGALVARYHKKHLFFEFQYDVPVQTDLSYFDTPFGRLGTFVCFDVIFYEPPVRLVEEYSIDTVVFPTAWMNVLPYFSAVPFHSAFAAGMGVNYLASNLHDPENRFSGSGIYSFNEVVSYRNDETSEEGALLISDVPIKPVKTPRQNVTFDDIDETEGSFTGEIFDDVWKFVTFPDEAAGEVAVCQNSLCCHLTYERQTTADEAGALFALGVFRGLHTEEGTYYLELCGLLKCLTDNPDSCGQDVRSSNSHFSYFNLTGNFTTNYVFPMVVTDEINPSAGEWRYDGKSTVSNGTSNGLVSAIQFGRRYDLDSSINISASDISTKPDLVLIGAFLLFCFSVPRELLI